MTIVSQAVIFVGGRGKRLKPLTDKYPKPMVLVNGKPFLDYLIYSLINVGIKNFLFLVGYKYEFIVERYSNLKHIKTAFNIGLTKDDLEKRLIDARDKLKNKFILLYGDNYWKIEKDNFFSFAVNKNDYIINTSYSNLKGTGEYGFINNLMLNNNFQILKYGKSIKHNAIDIGYFFFKKKFLRNIKKNYSFKKFFKLLISKGFVYSYVTNEQYYYITNMNSLKKFERFVKKNNIIPLPNNYFRNKKTI